MNAIYLTVRNAFFGILITEGTGFPPKYIGWLSALRSAVILLFFFAVLPRLTADR